MDGHNDIYKILQAAWHHNSKSALTLNRHKVIKYLFAATHREIRNQEKSTFWLGSIKYFEFL